MKNFIQRAITGIVFVAIVLASIYFQPEYNTLTILFLWVMIFGLQEFYTMVNKGFNLQVPTLNLIYCGIILYTLISIIAKGDPRLTTSTLILA
jgi:CDP-diglyceride synthetase